MKRVFAMLMFATLLVSSFTGFSGQPASAAADDVQLIVHYYKDSGIYRGDIGAKLLHGGAGEVTEKTVDDYGLKMTFKLNSNNDGAYIGLTVAEDSNFPSDLRYVRASNGVAEVWLIDGDARVYSKPIAIAPELIVKKNFKGYVAIEDLQDLLGVTHSYGKNGYLFDDLAPNTANIVTLFYGRDYFEINIDSNRIGSNVTGNMLKEYTKFVFSDVDGFRQGDRYYLSLGYIERLFQVRSLSVGSQQYLLKKQEAAYNQLAYADRPEDVGFSSAKLDAIDQYVEQQIAAGFPGAAMIVVKDGKIVKESAYGYAKKYSTKTVTEGVYESATLLPESEWQPVTKDTLFDLASNSKMYATNYAIQKLVSEGRLDLDQRLVDFPGWENFRDDYAVYTGKFTEAYTKGKKLGKNIITIRDILHHYGGLIPDPEYPNLTSADELWYQTSDPSNRDGIIDVICKTPLMYEPRTTFAYSDVDYMILGLLVEQITGMQLDQYVEQEIYGKMGLSDTMFTPLKKGVPQSRIAATELNGNTRDGNVTFGAMPDGAPVPQRKYTLQGEVHDEKAWYSMAGVAGHAGLFSTTGDMARLTQLMLNGGIYNDSQFFTQEVRDEFITPYDPKNPNNSTIGLGWRLHSKSASAYYYFNWGPSRSTYGHQGWTGTLTIIDPVYNMTITILTNSKHSPVVTPPNGFATGDFALADMVTLSAQVYQALNWDKEQYNTIQSVAAVKDVEVDYGTSLEESLASLPQATTITDAKGSNHTVALNWTIDGYDGSKAGSYTATGTFALPSGVVQSAPPLKLEVTAQVTVRMPSSSGPGYIYIPSNNAELQGLEVRDNGEAVALTPEFAPDTTAYEGQVKGGQVELTVKTAHAAAKVTLDGAPINGTTTLQLAPGENRLKLTVQAENGTTKTYTLTLQRDSSETGTPEPELGQQPVRLTDLVGHWAEAVIKQAAAQHIVTGYTDGTFKPDQQITRAEFTALLARALKLEGDGAAVKFTDQGNIGKWAARAIGQAVQAGIVTGYADGSFRPDAAITRIEMAAMFARAIKLDLANAANAATGFADDKEISKWAKASVKAVKEQGIVQGRSGNRFAPQEQAARAEAVVMLMRMLSK
ncbi:penicillin binding protein PBP4B [Paenibacillus sp. GCM10027626]|uniref:penicillin binding protein PBP4B n=1 Tax=Paenibacillus sp. GCM10027626 TaxID=3273411 RepID=UPI00362A917E